MILKSYLSIDKTFIFVFILNFTCFVLLDFLNFSESFTECLFNVPMPKKMVLIETLPRSSSTEFGKLSVRQRPVDYSSLKRCNMRLSLPGNATEISIKPRNSSKVYTEFQSNPSQYLLARTNLANRNVGFFFEVRSKYYDCSYLMVKGTV